MGKKNANGEAGLFDKVSHLAEQRPSLSELRNQVRDTKGRPFGERMEAILRLVKAMRDEEIVLGADANFLVAHPIMMIARTVSISVPTKTQLSRRSRQG